MHRFVVAALSLALSAVPCATLRAATHDFDGDGNADVAWRDGVTGRNAIWRSGNASAQLAVQAMADPRWHLVGAGDFDGDGRADLLWRHSTNGGDMIWHGGNASQLQSVARVGNTAWHVAGVGDFDGDGRADIVWRNLADGGVSVWPSADITRARALPTIRLAWTIAGVGDLDADGRDDLVWRHLQSGADVAWRSADPATPLAITGVTNQDWKIAAVDDFNGDTRADLLWRDTYDGRNVIWFGANASTMQVLPVVAQDWGIAGSGDFDGDSVADVLWRQASSGRNALWNHATPNTAHALATVANNAWRVVPYEGERVHPLASALIPVVDEGNTERIVPLRIALSHDSDQALDYTLSFDTSSEFSATLGEDFDLAGPASGRIPAGDTHVDIPLRIHGDTVPEANEPILVSWLGMDGAIQVPTGAGLLRNDDANTVWIDAVRTFEGNTGTHTVRVQVTLSRPQSASVAMDLFTNSGPGVFRASPDVDYVSIPTVVATIPPGATQATFNVTIIGDTRNEPIGEGFDIAVRSLAGAVLVGDNGSVFIIDDDPPIIP